jgi:uncharacterized protein
MWALSLLTAFITALAIPGLPSEAADPPPWVRISYVSFGTLHPDTPLTVAGRLMVPRNAPGKVPAVLIVHGSAGPDSRGPLMAEALTKTGIATLEIDMWAPRGLTGGPTGRPRRVTETLPDAFGALKFLASHPAIDLERIGITGFSWGGVVSMLTASKPLVDQYGPPGLRFKAHAPFYPACWVYNNEQLPEPKPIFKELTGAPVFIQGGELDTYDAPDSCQKLVDSLPEASRALVRLKMYPGVTHGFDSTAPERVSMDSAANLGRGGEVRMTPNPAVAATAREATAKFFSEVFGLSN